MRRFMRSLAGDRMASSRVLSDMITNGRWLRRHHSSANSDSSSDQPGARTTSGARRSSLAWSARRAGVGRNGGVSLSSCRGNVEPPSVAARNSGNPALSRISTVSTESDEIPLAARDLAAW